MSECFDDPLILASALQFRYEPVSNRPNQHAPEHYMSYRIANYHTELQAVILDCSTYHMLTPCHETLVDDFGSIVATSVDMYTFFDNRIRSSSQRFARLVSARLYLWRCRHGCDAKVCRCRIVWIESDYNQSIFCRDQIECLSHSFFFRRPASSFRMRLQY